MGRFAGASAACVLVCLRIELGLLEGSESIAANKITLRYWGNSSSKPVIIRS